MRLTILLLVLFISGRDGNAQVVTPAGFTRHPAQRTTLSSGHSSSPVWSLQADTTHQPPLWPWALAGAVAGAAVGAAIEARNVARSDDYFFPQLAIVGGLAVGALGGAAVGAVIGTIYHAVVHE